MLNGQSRSIPKEPGVSRGGQVGPITLGSKPEKNSRNYEVL